MGIMSPLATLRIYKGRCVFSLFSLFTLLGCLLFLAGCGPGASGQPSKISGIFSHIHMIDASVGWAVSWNVARNGANSILKTSDGGVHWNTVLQCLSTQGLGKGFMEPCATDFHSTSVATVVQPEYDDKTQVSRIRIFHTSDGGQSWQNSVLKARDLETPAVFVDALHGWELATDNFPGPDPSSAYIGSHIALYRTSDGGQSWQRIASGLSTSQIPETSDDAYGYPPFAASARMQFVSASTGWLIGTSSHHDSSNYSWLYVTHDGGNSWKQVTLSFPDQALALWQPTFFTQQQGLFPVLTTDAQSKNGTLLYTTQDGGKSWSSTKMPFDVTNAIFIDMNNAVNPSNDSKSIYTTSDGWKHWANVSIKTSFKRIYSFDFVSLTQGWALADNRTLLYPEPGGGIRKGDVISLLQTSDGGQTWQEIARSTA